MDKIVAQFTGVQIVDAVKARNRSKPVNTTIAEHLTPILDMLNAKRRNLSQVRKVVVWRSDLSKEDRKVQIDFFNFHRRNR